MIDRREFLLAVGAQAAASVFASPLARAGENAGDSDDFDFLVGDWHVHHRFLRARGASLEWAEGAGVCRHTPFAGGWGNIEEYVIRTERGVRQAIGLRAHDPQARHWSIWWLDERYPLALMDPPTRGGFSGGVGTFTADKTIDGVPTRERFLWSGITANSARWEQAHSTDAGRTWQTNWIMSFRRASAADPISLATGQTSNSKRSPDFDFLVGEWKLHHRKLLTDGRWVEFDGPYVNRPLMEGQANMEELFLPQPTGAYRAVGLRAFDPATSQWGIWWLDQRYPSRPVDPPVVGGFENGVGKFYSEYEVDGAPARGRFIWSDITSTSARWEQAQSLDAGQTWQPNWIIDFRK
jgi:hypothetical protein